MAFKKFSLLKSGEATVSDNTEAPQFAVQISLAQCASGNWLAWYQNRPDIMAHGETTTKALSNLDKMYQAVIEYEANDIH